MRLTSNQALERLMYGTGMRKAKGEPLQLLDRVKSNRRDRLFIFGRGDTAIVAPADDQLPAQVAEFDFGSGIINPSAQLLMDDYAMVAKAVQDGEIDECPPLAASPDGYVAPLMPEIYWHQHTPFNDRLELVEVVPTKGLVEKCIAGCPATAVAQLVYYMGKRGWKRGCVATPAYVSQTFKGYQFDVPGENARQSFDFDNILDVYTRRSGAKYVPVVSYTDEQAMAAADLVAHVGKAMSMKYSPTSSGQIDSIIADAMENKLHLGKVTMYKQGSKADASSTKYLEKVRESLAYGMPVVICGYTGTTSSASGHCFLTDGYRPSDDTYHINWGWGKGFNNGWFSMSLLSYVKKESSYNYSFAKTFLVIDKPSWTMDVNRDGYINMSDVTQVIDASISGKYDPMADVNYDGKVDMEDAQAITNKILGKNQ